jgi:hypothetical protein
MTTMDGNTSHMFSNLLLIMIFFKKAKNSLLAPFGRERNIYHDFPVETCLLDKQIADVRKSPFMEGLQLIKVREMILL